MAEFERTFLRGVSVRGPHEELGLAEDQSKHFPEGSRWALGPETLAEMQARGVLEALPGDPAPTKDWKGELLVAPEPVEKPKKRARVENLADHDGDGAPGGDAAAAKA